MNEARFREIAEAHEILAAHASREEYDYRRAIFLNVRSRSSERTGSRPFEDRGRERDAFFYDERDDDMDQSFQSFFESANEQNDEGGHILT